MFCNYITPQNRSYKSVYLAFFRVRVLDLFDIINDNLCRTVSIDPFGVDRNVIVVNASPNPVGIKVIERAAPFIRL